MLKHNLSQILKEIWELQVTVDYQEPSLEATNVLENPSSCL